MPTTATAGFLKSVHYLIPKIGEHGLLSCFLGNHWWTLVRQTKNGAIVGVKCGACHKPLKVNDIGVN